MEKTMKTFKVELTKHPECFTVQAENKEEAVRKAKEEADFSVFSVEDVICLEEEPFYAKMRGY